jgi:hypothetical protein
MNQSQEYPGGTFMALTFPLILDQVELEDPG